VRQSVLGHDVVVGGAVPMAQLASFARAHLADVGGPPRAGVRVGSGAMAGSARAGETSAASSASEESTMFDRLVSGAVACGCGVSVVFCLRGLLRRLLLRARPSVFLRVVVQTLEVEPIRGLEVALDHAASTAFQISGAVLCLTRSLSSLN
jgi:hypothetical protein